MLRQMEESLRAEALGDDVDTLTVGVAVVRGDEALVIRRADRTDLNGYWELPNVIVKEDESFLAAMKRCLAEYMGLDMAEVLVLLGYVDLIRDGQRTRQINFVVTVEVQDIVVDMSGHDEWRWVTAEDIEDLSLTDKMREAVLSIWE